jgi:hypothetical protein
MEPLQKLHKRKGKNYSFSIKMSTRIKRLTFEMLYCKSKSKNANFRNQELIKVGAKWSSQGNFTLKIFPSSFVWPCGALIGRTMHKKG